MFIYLNEKSVLYIYKKHGVILLPNRDYIKIDKNIAEVIRLNYSGLSLYDALESVGSDKEKTFIGVMQLLLEDKLVCYPARDYDIEYRIVDESDIFYPESIHFELTNKCNLRCYYCYNDSGVSMGDSFIETTILFDIITELSMKGLSVIELTGGEPLLHPDFVEIIDFCFKKLSLISVLTNGTMITERFVNSMMPYKSKLVFSISLDSYDENEYEKKSGVKGSFKKASEGIKLLSDKGFIVRAAMTIDENNWNHIEETLLYAKSLGATKFTYSPVIPIGRAEKLTQFWTSINSTDVMNYEMNVIDKYSDYIHLLDDTSMKELSKYGGCGAGSRTYVMNPHGAVRMCATYADCGIIGNLTKQNSREVFSNVLCAVNSNLILPNDNICGNCLHIPFCKGCSLRTYMKIKEIGEDNCNWLQQCNNAQHWYKIMSDYNK